MPENVKVDTPEQAEFRAYCRKWLKENKPGPPPEDMVSKEVPGQKSQARHDYEVAWQRSAYKAGLVGCDYPKEYGGGGHTDFQRIANEEMLYAGTPFFPNPIGNRMVAPTLMIHGSEYLKKRFIPNILSCEEIWSQGFSEPNAGSDVANQETFAEKKGDQWVVNGQKIWTSYAEFSDWMILLTRTDRSHKHKGLTYFVCPVKENLGKSVEVRPLIKITGEAGFNEVFFKDMVIPDKYRIDEEGSGWAVAMTTLMFERGAGQIVAPVSGYTSLPPIIERNLSESPIVGLAKISVRNGKRAADDPVLRDRIMKIIIRQTAFSQTNRRARVKGLVDHPSRIPLQIKLVESELYQDHAALAVDIAGMGSTLRSVDKNAPHRGRWPYDYINSFGGTIARGTSEIQRNQIGERVLGMPKSK